MDFAYAIDVFHKIAGLVGSTVVCSDVELTPEFVADRKAFGAWLRNRGVLLGHGERLLESRVNGDGTISAIAPRKSTLNGCRLRPIDQPNRKIEVYRGVVDVDSDGFAVDRGCQVSPFGTVFTRDLVDFVAEQAEPFCTLSQPFTMTFVETGSWTDGSRYARVIGGFFIDAGADYRG